MKLGRIILAAGLACALVPVVSAQLKKAPSPVGVWEFKTAEMTDSCTIAGQMTVVAAGKTSKTFTCSFKAVQDCTAGTIRTIHTEQSCVATQTGSQVVVTSSVDRIVSVKPAALMKGMDKRYAPDNFDVTINVRGDEMDGLFESMGTAPVKFRRKQDLVS